MKHKSITIHQLQNHGIQWVVHISSQEQTYTLTFQPDSAGKFCRVDTLFPAMTLEEKEVGSLLERVHRGEEISLPYQLDLHPPTRRLPEETGIQEAWLISVESTGNSRWLAQLILDKHESEYELEILPGPVLCERRGPQMLSFQGYTYDLTRLLLRIHNGERFALPFRLRPRWPTPPDAPSISGV